MARVRVTTSHARRVVARYNAVDSPDNCSIKVKKIKKVHMVDKCEYKVPKSRNYITEWPFVRWPFVGDTIRYDTRCYFNVRSKADISQLNLPHGTDN